MSDAADRAKALSDDAFEALVETMALAAHADDELSDDELAKLAATVESIAPGRLAGDKIAALLASCAQRLTAEGREARLAAVAKVLPAIEDRKLALSLALGIMAADGVIRTSERELILE